MYSDKLMSDVYWGFYGGKYSSSTKFVQDVMNYNQNLGKKWNPNEIVLISASATIQYSYWDDSEEDETEENFDLIADSKLGFTAGELLYKIHNSVIDKLENEDHHFFEGLTLWEGENYSNPNAPLYFLNQGS